MNAKEMREKIEEKFRDDVSNAGKALIDATHTREAFLDCLNSGALEPVLDYFQWMGFGSYITVTLPLNKKLFHEKIWELKALGWKPGKVDVNSSSASCVLEYGTGDGLVRLNMNAYGDGVNCRIVELQPPQYYKAGVFEWVCEEGAKEIEDLMSKEE